jgi:predicted dehydrogenase
MTKKLGWGILSTGNIAKVFAQGLTRTESGRLVAVGSRTGESARKFAAANGNPRAHGSYEALLADPEVEAVYIATPHPQHIEWVIRAAEAGKHILCEKPIGVNYAEAMVMAEAARAHGVLLMEAFMYRCHPQTAKLVELIRKGAIGEVKLVQATFGFNAGFNADSRLWSNALAGGGILDVGCYPMSFARLIAGAMGGVPFLNPISVTGAGQLHPETGVDAYAAATLKFANGMVAQLATSVGVSQDNSARIYGSAGMIVVPSPWIPPSNGEEGKFSVHKDGKVEEIVTVSPGNLYGFESDAVAAALARGEREVPAMSVADTLGNMAGLDAWRAAIGLTYESEKPENFLSTHSRRPLARRADANIPTGTIPHLAKPVSRLIMGCDNTVTMPHSAAMWDDYYERGGNTFDTAYVYGGGLQEKLLGQWIKNRGIREEVSVIAKGAHTPFCTPEWLTKQLEESLGRLQTPYADIYMLHRDNLEVPIGEFVEVLNEHVKAGRIRAFGGSNCCLYTHLRAHET